MVLDFIGNHKTFFRNAIALFHVGASQQAREDFIGAVDTGTLPLPEGCFVNYDVKAIEFMALYKEAKTDKQAQLYRSLKLSLDRRPTLAEFYRTEGNDMTKLRSIHGQWLNLVEQEGDLTEDEKECLKAHGAFFKALEKTVLTNANESEDKVCCCRQTVKCYSNIASRFAGRALFFRPKNCLRSLWFQ